MKEIEIEIDDALIAQFENLPDLKGVQWTPEKDALLLKYWPVKQHKDVAKLLGTDSNMALNRYRKLTENEGK